jgi:putative ABC transport system permease protein
MTTSTPAVTPPTSAEVRAIVDRAIDRYIAARHDKVAAFVDGSYSLIGSLRPHRRAGLGTAIAWAVTVRLMHLEWTPQPGVIATTVLLGVVITLTLGFAGTWRRLGRGAGAFLRND